MQVFGSSGASRGLSLGLKSKRVQGNRLDVPKISFYQLPPSHEVSLEEFETLALNRLKALKAYQELESRGLSFDRLGEQLRLRLKQYLPMKTEEDMSNDNTSHYVLRLAFCRNEGTLCPSHTRFCTVFSDQLFFVFSFMV